MKSGLLTLLAATGLLASAAIAQEVDQERLDQFSAIIVAAGCTMTQESTGALMPANGFTDMDETRKLIGLLIEQGTASFAGGVVKIETSDCADIETPMDVLKAEFIAFMAKRDCKIAYDESRTALPEAGFELDTIDQLIGELLKTKLVSIDGPNQIVTLSQELMSESAVCGVSE